MLGASSERKQDKFLEEDFTLLDDDAITNMTEGVSSITFSDRVKEYIKRRMVRTVILKLLGGRIGFNALLNKKSLIWGSQGHFQLMDLENDFYLIRFQEEVDYSKVLTACPRIIFGKYLSVRPWSPEFTIA